MKQRIMNHASILVVLSVLLTFIAASTVMYGRLNNYMRQGVRDEALYIQAAMEQMGESFLTDEIGSLTSSRITLLDEAGKVLYDSNADVEELTNHSDRPEIREAFTDGEAEEVRYSETLSERTYYYALRLADGKILRVARTAESAVLTLLSSFTLLGGLVIVILVLEFFLVQKQTRDLIAPINELDLENPLKEVRYEELRPLLMRVDRQNKQIARQVEELKAAEAMRREFSANVSHELKTPLMSISGYAELMMNGMVRPEDVPEFSGRIYHEATRLSSLVADIIQLSRMDGAASDMPFENVDICELGEDIVTHLTPAADKKQISLAFSGEEATVYGVRQILYEMFYNLADNAIRYTDEGGEVRISIGHTGNHIFYQVCDNGIGISKEEQGRIFERFYRVDKSHSRQTGGTGLGLSIVKHGAALHKADIYLDSAPGEGTKIELVF